MPKNENTMSKQTREASPVIPSIQLVSAARAAQILAISPRKLWELSNCEKIRHLRIGRGVRYDVADLTAWIEALKEGGGME